MKKRAMTGLLTLVLLLAGCTAKQTVVPVVSVGMLTGAGTAAEKYAGEVVSEGVVQVQRDEELEIGKLNVQVGDRVRKGDVLFSYDMDLLELDLERAKLELEQMRAAVSTYTTQIAELKTKIKETKDQTEKMGYEIRLQELEVDKQAKEYEIDAKEKEIAYDQSVLRNGEVTAPVDGRIRSVEADGFDDYGNPAPYITIQPSGAYRIQAAVNELNLLSPDCSVTVDAKVRVVSRVDNTRVWSGTISQIDTESPQSQDGAATEYPFYVEVEDTNGLLLGQHVYVEILTGVEREGVWMPEGYLMDVTAASQGENGTVTTAWVWAADGNDCLERRTVQLGGYDKTLGAYEILVGLSAEDYVADPANGACAEGVQVEYRSAADFGQTDDGERNPGSTGENSTGTGDTQPDGEEPGTEPTPTSQPQVTQQTDSASGGDLEPDAPVSGGDLEPDTAPVSDGDLNATGMPGEKARGCTDREVWL